MSMIGSLLRVEAKELEQILEDSDVLETILDKAMEEESAELIDLDKAWEAIYYMLTGYGISNIENAVPPLSWTLFSGQVVDEEQDLGYGPGNYVTAQQVKQVNQALQDISADEMKKRFDGTKMMKAGIYPEIWNEPEVIDYIMEYFQSLKDFYAEAAKRSQAIISFLN